MPQPLIIHASHPCPPPSSTDCLLWQIAKDRRRRPRVQQGRRRRHGRLVLLHDAQGEVVAGFGGGGEEGAVDVGGGEGVGAGEGAAAGGGGGPYGCGHGVCHCSLPTVVGSFGL